MEGSEGWKEGMGGHLRLAAARPGATLPTAIGMRLIFREEMSSCSTTRLTLVEEEEVREDTAEEVQSEAEEEANEVEEADRARVGILETKRVTSARVARTRAGAWIVLPRLAILRRLSEGRAGRGMREAARTEAAVT